MEYGKNLRTWVDGQPQPQYVLRATQSGAQFVQLKVREPKIREGALVEGLSVLPSAGQPGGDRGLTVSEDPLGSGRVQPFGEGREHHCDLVRGSLQTIQGGVASGSERGVTGRASKRLDPLDMAMLAIPDEGVDMSIGDAGVRTLRVGTGEALGIHPLGRSPPAFHLTPRSHRQRRWPDTQRGSGGETTGGAVTWGAWLEKTLYRGAHGSCF